VDEKEVKFKWLVDCVKKTIEAVKRSTGNSVFYSTVSNGNKVLCVREDKLPAFLRSHKGWKRLT
jgi:hypothetical protein